jgi:hypothetical protein
MLDTGCGVFIMVDTGCGVFIMVDTGCRVFIMLLICFSDEEKHSGIVSKLVSEKSSMKSGYRSRGSKPTSVVPDGNLSAEEEVRARTCKVEHDQISTAKKCSC